MYTLYSSLNSLLACTVCWSGGDQTMNAANLAVGFMFVVLLMVLGSFLAFIFVLARRSRQAEPVPVRVKRNSVKTD